MKKNNDKYEQNITNVSPSKVDKMAYFKLPSNIEKLAKEKGEVDTSPEGQKKGLEKQMQTRMKYIELIEKKEKLLKKYIDKNKDDEKLKTKLKVNQARIDRHNIKQEILAQKNVFLDTYIYYEEDFMKRYKEGGGKNPKMFNVKNK